MMIAPDLPVAPCEPDRRFRELLGQEAWMQLPEAVRRRFGKRLAGGASVTYRGRVVAMEMSLAGKILAQAARLIGAPLPHDATCLNQPAVVVVTEDTATNGQFWIRQYGRARGFPQVIHSSKRFTGPTGLEEYLGYGIGMALKTEVRNGALLFKSDHYVLQVFGRRIRLPRILSPGALVIGHHDLGDGRFLFSLDLTNRLFGRLIRQDALFHDARE